MKNENLRSCPGCGKHCPENALRCKRGRAWLAQISESVHIGITGEEMLFSHKHKHKHTHKWEKNITRGGLAWHLVSAGRRTRKGLRDKKLTEEQIFARLSPSERQTLYDLLGKLDGLEAAE